LTASVLISMALLACARPHGHVHTLETLLALTVPAPADVAAAPADAIKTDSGVPMTILRAGHGTERPQANDCVTVHFTGWKRDGSFLVSSRVGGEPESQCLKTMFAGVADALQTMVIGEERRLWVPADLTYKTRAWPSRFCRKGAARSIPHQQTD
jgi:hypothetical protein